MLSRLAWLAVLAASVAADDLLPNLSFQAPYSPNTNRIDHFTLMSSGHELKVHSDRIILTPPYPANTRGGIWSEGKTSAYDWSAELVFRANGPSSGASGNLQIWATDDPGIGSNSVYTVGRFDGLVIVVDQYGGGGGKIRGFLNDGSQQYNMVPNVASLAFGHCDYSYRNRGATSTLKIENHKGLTVSIDGTQCFHSDRIAIPPGQHFGISAATAENPDSFEITSFKVNSLGPVTYAPAGGAVNNNNHHQASPSHHEAAEPNWHNFQNPNADNQDTDQDPNQLVDHQRQFNDLHTRLQHMAHTLAGISTLLLEEEERGHNRQEALMKNVAFTTDLDNLYNQINKAVEKVESLERAMGHAGNSGSGVSGSGTILSSAQMEELKLAAKHAAPSLFTLGLTILGVQLVIVAAFSIYTARGSQPKKYL